MTPEDQAFLRDIIAHPDDLSVRLIYADWLEDHGDPRAELIRVQCQLESMDISDERRSELKSIEKHLLTAGEAQWFAPFQDQSPTFNKNTATIARGFIDSVRVLIHKNGMEEVSKAFEWEPIRSLYLHVIHEGEGKKLADWTFLQRIRELHLLDLPDSVDSKSFFCSPYLTQLQRLFLSGRLFREGRLSANDLALGSSLGSLESLDVVSDGRIGASGLGLLLNSANLTEITRFKLTSERLGSHGPEMLADQCRWDQLTELELCNCEITEQGYRALSQAKWLSRLTTLKLEQLAMKPNAAVGFFKHAKLNALTILSLTHNRLGVEGIRALSESNNLDELRILNLDRNQLNDSAIKALATFRGRNLESLVLAQNEIGDEGAKGLGNVEAFGQLRKLNLGCNKLSKFGIRELFAPGILSGLHELTLSRNRLNDQGIQALAIRSKDLPKLQRLNLNDVGEISETGMKALLETAEWPNLRHLELNGNDLNSNAIQRLCKSPVSQQLAHLELEGTLLQPSSIQHLLQLAESKNLQTISLVSEGKPLMTTQVAQLKEAFGERLITVDTTIPF